MRGAADLLFLLSAESARRVADELVAAKFHRWQTDAFLRCGLAQLAFCGLARRFEAVSLSAAQLGGTAPLPEDLKNDLAGLYKIAAALTGDQRAGEELRFLAHAVSATSGHAAVAFTRFARQQPGYEAPRVAY